MKNNFIRSRAGRVLLAAAAAACTLGALALPHPQLPGGPPPVMSPTVNLQLPDRLDFCGEAVPMNEPHIRQQAEREFYLMMQDQGQLIINIKRAGIFFPIFEKICKQDSVPDDIKYIAVIESALRNARSAKDAMGIWQFIESSGRKFGLQIDKDVDERLNIAKATHAACAHFHEGYNLFHSWTMAAAEYNMGPENLIEQSSYQGDSNFYHLYLNEETSRYIFRAAVMKELMAHHDLYGIHLSNDEIYHQDSLSTVPEPNAINDLQTWALQHNTTYKWVKIFNPWILKRALPKPPVGNWEIVVPVFPKS